MNKRTIILLPFLCVFFALWYIAYRLLVCGAYAWHWARLQVFLIINKGMK